LESRLIDKDEGWIVALTGGRKPSVILLHLRRPTVENVNKRALESLLISEELKASERSKAKQAKNLNVKTCFALLGIKKAGLE